MLARPERSLASSSSLPLPPSLVPQDMASPLQEQSSPPKELLNAEQGGQALEKEAAGAMEMHGADIEDTDWSRAPIDVQTNYRIEKKVGCSNGF